MATSSTELARLMNLNQLDSNALADALGDYFGSRIDSEDDTDHDESSSEDESNLDADESEDPDFHVVIPDLPELVLPRGRGEVDSDSASVSTSGSSTPNVDPPRPLCTCKLNGGKPCYTNFAASEIESCQLQYIALEREELDIALLAKIQCGIHMDNQTRSSKKGEQNERKKVRLQYFHHGNAICRKFFRKLHHIGDDKLDALIAHFKLNGVEARIHKNSKRLPAKTLKYEDSRRVLDFIINYAEINAIQLPGRTPKHWLTNIKLLPTNVTKRSVYEEYKISCEDGEHRYVKLRTFRKLWQQLCPFVRTMLPATDLCWICQNGTYKIAQAANKTDEQKQKVIKDLQDHQNLVTQERLYYQRTLKEIKEKIPASLILSNENRPHCSFQGMNHLSFDFAQQVHFPYDPLQPGPIFFKTPRKCGLFGINCEPVSRQVNYVIDEAHSCGKGANTVISYLHHYLDCHGLGECHLHLHADNCSGQNKNSFVIWYLMWRTLTGRHRTITLSFLISGHTKFSPDGGFGLIKKRYRRTKVNCLDDIKNIINSSAEMNIAELVGSETGPSTVPVHDWSGFLAAYFFKVKRIKSFHHFLFDGTGNLSVKEHSEADEEKQHLLRREPDPTAFPDPIKPEGLSQKRQWYLFREIRPFVSEDKQDIVAPKPPLPETAPASSSSEDEDIEPPPRKKTRAPQSSRGRKKL